jgi:hypothetical protein
MVAVVFYARMHQQQLKTVGLWSVAATAKVAVYIQGGPR